MLTHVTSALSWRRPESCHVVKKSFSCSFQTYCTLYNPTPSQMAYYHQPAMDDVFDEDGDEDMIVEREWKRTRNGMRKTGYRQGLTAGEEETLQQGFDTGYAEASKVAFTVARLQGQISATKWIHDLAVSGAGDVQGEGSRTVTAELSKLIEDCTDLQKSIPHMLQTHIPPLTAASATHMMPTTTLTQSDNITTDQSALRNGDGLGEITEHLGALGLQELPPIRHPILNQNFVELLRRYRSLLHLQRSI